ncbi:acetolactate synthase, small subunit [Pyrinomonas methylaliphatogenes]|uniref:Acetolactate synthase small subunit n=2 Tax=Pyrinomonas methylaliphatogenes TaxID=454194 RepID=A0A0B6WTS9_9BACT|nr:acetolactate synthase, small subunit [Pyrinomonas methylaliphatogenes]
MVTRMRHTLSIVVADQPGELSRIVGLFSARGFNIEALSVAQTFDPQWSRVTVVTHGDPRVVEQIAKQCARLVRVREVQNVTEDSHIERQMALITVNAASGGQRQELLQLVSVFGAKLVDISGDRAIVEFSGKREELATFIEALRPLGVLDIVRSGAVAVERLTGTVEAVGSSASG